MLHVAGARDGSSAITGYFDATLDLGGVELDGVGAFVAKYSGDGRVVWARSFGISSSCGQRVAIAESGDVYIAGGCGGPLVFGRAQVDCDGSFVASYDTDGMPRWLVSYPSETPAPGGIDLALDGTGGVVTTAYQNGGELVHGTSLLGTPTWTRKMSASSHAPELLAPAPGGGVLVVADDTVSMLSASGAVRWTRQMPGSLAARAVTVLASGTSIIASDELWALDPLGQLTDSITIGQDRYQSIAALRDGGLAVLAGTTLVTFD